jgi:NTE family protein
MSPFEAEVIGTRGDFMYGLVLEGGGSKGSYQIGACKALNELGIEIGAVAGTSVGALNGAMVVQGDVDLAYRIWSEITPESIIKIPGDRLEDYVGNGYRAGTLKMFIHKIKRIAAEGGLNVEPLVELAKSTLSEDRIRRSPIGFGIVTVDVTARKAVEIYKEEIPEGQLSDYIIASASFPAFKRAVIDGRIFIDGAFYNNLPINMISSRGYRDIIVLRTYGIGMRRRIDTSGLNIITISPQESLGPTLDFSNETSRKNLKKGYNDVFRVFGKL